MYNNIRITHSKYQILVIHCQNAQVIPTFSSVLFVGHTSVKMCERMMGSIDLLKACRKTYTAKEGFDEHSTTRHSVADPFHDQLKGAWFCLQNGLLDPSIDKESPCCYPVDGGKPSGNVAKSLLGVTDKGIAKISQNFKYKLYESFPDLRYELLCNAQ